MDSNSSPPNLSSDPSPSFLPPDPSPSCPFPDPSPPVDVGYSGDIPDGAPDAPDVPDGAPDVPSGAFESRSKSAGSLRPISLIFSFLGILGFVLIVWLVTQSAHKKYGN
ncbi:hypothetical protein EDB92DRAFT_1817214 [Lactarius akahatsu]|uniref:Uncharacterized protein n=1 Tax=Lactarius akahatsu TaxID=416441 RepID=A0AAD4LF55_9AGAM|nr:hypothetical protein EDB92DRAFT_1817214 [Lactarius akahatsu]